MSFRPWRWVRNLFRRCQCCTNGDYCTPCAKFNEGRCFVCPKHCGPGPQCTCCEDIKWARQFWREEGFTTRRLVKEKIYYGSCAACMGCPVHHSPHLRVMLPVGPYR